MKKIILLITLSLLLTACGKKGKPDKMPQVAYDTGIEALKVINNYLNGEVDINETVDIYDRATEDFLTDMESYEKLSLDEKLSSMDVSSVLVSMKLKLSSIYNSWLVPTDIEADKKEIKKLRDELKKTLGE